MVSERGKWSNTQLVPFPGPPQALSLKLSDRYRAVNRRKPDTGNAALFSSECESLLSCSTNRRINISTGAHTGAHPAHTAHTYKST